MAESSEVERAWAAGLFDGEGCLCFPKRGARVIMRLAMTEREPVEVFANIVGPPGRKLYIITPRNPKHKIQYSWHITKQADVKSAIMVILPHLVLKRNVAIAALAELGSTPWSRRKQRVL